MESGLVGPVRSPLQWEKVDVYDGQRHSSPKKKALSFTARQLVVQDWVDEVPEVVDERYIDPGLALVYPLPPLAGRDWGEAVALFGSKDKKAGNVVYAWFRLADICGLDGFLCDLLRLCVTPAHD